MGTAVLRLLLCVQELGDSAAYAPLFQDLKVPDLQHARQVSTLKHTTTADACWFSLLLH
jgi:hypothetical protein